MKGLLILHNRLIVSKIKLPSLTKLIIDDKY